MTGFRPFFNPATGEWIEFTAVAEDSDGQLVRFSWRSMPGGLITEQIHPRQEERFIITSGEARFTLDGEELTARAGETVVVPAGVSHSEGNPGPAEIQAVRPALRTREFHEAVAGLAADGRTTPRGRAEKPAPAGRHLLALPPRKPGHLAAHRSAEHHAPAAVGGSEGLRRAPLLRPVGQPDPGGWPATAASFRARPRRNRKELAPGT
jgi:mannose-6-phosphate isomerase-like protein (cupin superfamily)